MANEYLTRTPTSTGNRRVWSWSGWVKLDKDTKGGNPGYYTFFSGGSGYANPGLTVVIDSIGSDLRMANFSNNGYFGYKFSKHHIRDVSSWYHIMGVVDTTLDDNQNRFRMYVNGVEDMGVPSLVTTIEKNMQTGVGQTSAHFLGAYDNNGTVDAISEFKMLDVFFVDGQALTPDVFGFHKPNEGYVSVGSTWTNQYQSGSWAPKKPSAIKNVINNNGGFGVNGFYLPMNDGSNPGADFHCNPNSIITLKGEDLPQPQNGAPTTTDAYVSQLRQESGTLGYDGVVKFDGTGDYLRVGSSSDFAFGSGDFTIEFWVYFDRHTNYQELFDFRPNEGAYPTMYADGNGIIYYWTNSGNRITSSAVSANTWHHIAVTRSGTSTKLFINGSQSGSTYSDSNTYLQSFIDIGASGFQSNYYFQGYVSNFRVIKGTALYTSTFTPPTEALTEITNTKLLCCNSSTSATAATVAPASITANGDAVATRNELTGSIVLAVPGITGGRSSGYGDYHADIRGSGSNKTLTAVAHAGVAGTASYYGSALSFDGTGDWFTIPANDSDFQFGSSDFTVECWVNPKINNNNGGIIGIWNNTDGRRSWLLYQNSSNQFNFAVSSNGSLTDLTSGVFTPPNIAGQWFHLVGERHGTATRLYVNGVVVGINTSAGSTSVYANTADKLTIGTWNDTNQDNSLDGHIQDVRVYKGVAKYKGQGFDVSRPYEPVGIATWRAVSDSVGNNFCNFNSLFNEKDDKVTLSDGNLSWMGEQSPGYGMVTGTIGISTGKWYWEVRSDGKSWPLLGNGVIRATGIGTIAAQEDEYVSGVDGGIGYYMNATAYKDRVYYWNGTSQLYVDYSMSGISTGDFLSVALDLDTPNNGKIYFAANNVWGASGNPSTGTNPVGLAITGIQLPAVSVGAAGTTSAQYNFGQNPTFSGRVSAGTFTDGNGKGLFKYEPPTGFLALCEDNLPTPAIADPGKHFKTVLYTGNGSTQAVTGFGFEPDLVWVKNRDNSYYHRFWDSVRGVGRTGLYSNTTEAEGHWEQSGVSGYDQDQVTSFDDDGFTVLKGPNGDGLNENTVRYVAWCWKAGGPAVLNTAGNINANVSANQTAGFSIVSYTGTGSAGTVGHGLGKAPSFIIVKNRDDTGASGPTNGNWQIWHSGFTIKHAIQLNLTSTTANGGSDTGYWNGTLPTSSVFSVGNFNSTNGSSDNMIAYCWAEIEGYSNFGSYEGNGDAEGPFVWCGFQPAWIMIKRIDSAGQWNILDTGRSPINPKDVNLLANAADLETYGSRVVDFVSNGFKPRNTTGDINADGGIYIFAAFASTPFKTARAK